MHIFNHYMNTFKKRVKSLSKKVKHTKKLSFQKRKTNRKTPKRKTNRKTPKRKVTMRRKTRKRK